MSAVLKDVPLLGPMAKKDLDEVLAIENAIYTHPWTRGNFADSLSAGYECRTWRVGRELVGYFVLMSGAGEAHLLNLSVAAAHQRSGHGSALLREAATLARRLGAAQLFLEVRPSNHGAQALYRRFGFRNVAVRRGYYPAQLFLEVRPSNHGAQALYRRFGFRNVAVRRGYYPAHSGREDALVLMLGLE